MGISPLGTGTDALGGFTSGGDTGTNIQRKLTELKKQREEFESAKNKVTDKNALSNKIAALDRRISNLESRLEKLREENGECQTCKNRKYQDGSDDPGVSFKSASHIDPDTASSVVRGHEMEHVYRNQAKAEREGREVVSQTVTLHTGICPECGRSYVSGGETRTVTRAKLSDVYNVGIEDKSEGKIFDSVA